MKRYLLRSLVAVLTFSIGVAIGSFGSQPSKHPRYRYRECNETKNRVRAFVPHESRTYRAGPYLSIDALSTDPLKLSYSSTTPIPNDLGRQKVEFTVANNTKREIANFTVAYKSRWRSMHHSGGGAVLVDSKTAATNLASKGLDVVSIECHGDENLTIWVSSVEFKDGSRWNNSRH